MNVKELIELLEQLPPEAEVIMAKDPEGNGFSPLSSITANAIYIAENTWSGEVYSTAWSAEDVGMDEEDWNELREKTPPCIVFDPIN